MLLPNGNRAIVDIKKLRDYCLNADSPRGKNKARLFASMLGITAAHAPKLRERLLQVARTEQARLGELDNFGQRYTIDFEMETDVEKAIVRSGWIVSHGEGPPRSNNLFRQEEEKVMTRKKIKLLDTIALLEDLPERKLRRGEVGTVVELLAPDVYEVEFCDDEGQTYAELALRSDQVIVLHNQGEALRVVA
jgi:Domain of unknown function (DUF4926)